MKNKLLIALLCLGMSPMTGFSKSKNDVRFGGALRFNYNFSDWKESHRKNTGDFGYDVFKLHADAKIQKVKLHAEYRFYSKNAGGGFLKSGWFGYEWNNHHEIQIGLTKVPFGILPYASNSFFFNNNYFIGLEDDNDMGIKYHYNNKHWDFYAAFFKNADLKDFGNNSETELSRYSYDIAANNKESNTGNIRLVYKFGHKMNHEIGFSSLYGHIYNIKVEDFGTRYAFALHYHLQSKHWDSRLEWINYNFQPKGINDKRIAMGAYGSYYYIAAKGNLLSATLAYTMYPKKCFFNSIKFYNDFSYINKANKNFYDTYLNTLGCQLQKGGVYTLIDLIVGKNHPYLGNNWDTALADGTKNAGFHTRFNINIGYYF